MLIIKFTFYTFKVTVYYKMRRQNKLHNLLFVYQLFNKCVVAVITTFCTCLFLVQNNNGSGVWATIEQCFAKTRCQKPD